MFAFGFGVYIFILIVEKEKIVLEEIYFRVYKFFVIAIAKMFVL